MRDESREEEQEEIYTWDYSEKQHLVRKQPVTDEAKPVLVFSEAEGGKDRNK